MCEYKHSSQGLPQQFLSFIDLVGKQGNLAKHFGLWEGVQAGEDRWPNITTIFQDQWRKIAEKLPTPVDDLIMPTGEGPDLIPAHESLDGLNATLGNIDDAAERYSRLNEFLTGYVADDYDVILLDLPGSTSNIATKVCGQLVTWSPSFVLAHSGLDKRSSCVGIWRHSVMDRASQSSL